VTVPIDKTLDGPGPPKIPSCPLGMLKIKDCDGDVPVIVTDAFWPALSVFVADTVKTFDGPVNPCGPGCAAMYVAISSPKIPRSLGTSGESE
jgi:hypothetical protein